MMPRYLLIYYKLTDLLFFHGLIQLSEPIPLSNIF